MSGEYNKEIIDSKNDEQEVEPVEASEDAEKQPSDSDELSEREKQFLARAKKAEAKLKATKEAVSDEEPEIKKVTKPTGLSTTEQVQREVFLATGGTLEQLEVLDSIVSTSLQEKKESPLYRAYLAQEESKKNDEQAQLGTSRGGKKVVTKKETRDERKARAEQRARELLNG